MRLARLCLAKRGFAKEEVEESFVRGARGNGGQALNTASNTVLLTHKDTGIQVRVADTRSLHLNRRIAEERLFDKVELATDPENARITLKRDKVRRRKAKAASRAKKKYSDDGSVVDEKM